MREGEIKTRTGYALAVLLSIAEGYSCSTRSNRLPDLSDNPNLSRTTGYRVRLELEEEGLIEIEGRYHKLTEKGKEMLGVEDEEN